jgi:hypothetical protein
VRDRLKWRKLSGVAPQTKPALAVTAARLSVYLGSNRPNFGRRGPSVQRGRSVCGSRGLAALSFGVALRGETHADLITRLESEQTGQLSHDFHHSGTQEVNQLAEAFNRAADAMLESQQHLNQAYLQFIETMAQALDARDPMPQPGTASGSATTPRPSLALNLPAEELKSFDRRPASRHRENQRGRCSLEARPSYERRFELIKLHPQIGKRILERVGRFQDYLPIVNCITRTMTVADIPYGLGKRNPAGSKSSMFRMPLHDSQPTSGDVSRTRGGILAARQQFGPLSSLVIPADGGEKSSEGSILTRRSTSTLVHESPLS